MSAAGGRPSVITWWLPAALERFGPLSQLWQRPAKRVGNPTGKSVAWVLAGLDSRYSGLVGVGREGDRLLCLVELFAT
jgi:hypothetical protein